MQKMARIAVLAVLSTIVLGVARGQADVEPLGAGQIIPKVEPTGGGGVTVQGIGTLPSGVSPSPCDSTRPYMYSVRVRNTGDTLLGEGTNNNGNHQCVCVTTPVGSTSDPVIVPNPANGGGITCGQATNPVSCPSGSTCQCRMAQTVAQCLSTDDRLYTGGCVVQPRGLWAGWSLTTTRPDCGTITSTTCPKTPCPCVAGSSLPNNADTGCSTKANGCRGAIGSTWNPNNPSIAGKHYDIAPTSWLCVMQRATTFNPGDNVAAFSTTFGFQYLTATAICCSATNYGGTL